MSQTEPIRRTCPYLGLTGDPSSHYRDPDPAHYCYSPKKPGGVEPDYQKRVCFSPEYGTCARFMAVAVPGNVTAPMAAMALRNRRLQWILLGLLVALPLLALVIALFFFSSPQPQIAQATVTSVATRTVTPRPTETPTLSAGTATATRRIVPTLAPLIIPTPPANGLLLTLSADVNRTGWVASNEPVVRWGERNLLVGALQGQTYIAVAAFDVNALPPGSRVLFGALEMTGRDAARLGANGSWQIELVDSALAENWTSASYAQIANAPALATIGQPVAGNLLDAGQPNRWELNAAQRQLLDKQIDAGTLTFRVRGPATGDNLFTWAAGGGTPTLYLVVQPGAFTIVTATPTPGSVMTAAAVAVRATEDAVRRGTPTRSRGIVTATPEIGLVYVTPQPTPANAATAQFQSQYATAVALTTGTFTPIPPNVRVVTATPTPVLVVAGRLTLVPTVTPTPLPMNYAFVEIPNELKGKIVAMSNRYPVTPAAEATATPSSQTLGPDLDRITFSANIPVVIDPANGNVIGILTSGLYYQAAVWRDAYSPDRRYLAYVTGEGEATPQVWVYDFLYGQKFQITHVKRTPVNTYVTRIAAHSPVWSPDGRTIAYVSNEYANDDIFTYDIEDKITKRLTTSEWWWYKHPSWSPDGKKIVYWSNRTGTPQIWMMDANGENQTILTTSPYNEINPVWVK